MCLCFNECPKKVCYVCINKEKCIYLSHKSTFWLLGCPLTVDDIYHFRIEFMYGKANLRLLYQWCQWVIGIINWILIYSFIAFETTKALNNLWEIYLWTFKEILIQAWNDFSSCRYGFKKKHLWHYLFVQRCTTHWRTRHIRHGCPKKTFDTTT